MTMNEMLTYTLLLPVKIAKPGVSIIVRTLEPDKKTETHKDCTIEEIQLRADTITQTLKSILDFHPLSYPNKP